MSVHIGVVEDDPNIQNIVRAYLLKEHYDVTILQSAEDALELWEENPPDMWILDIMLPGMDGYDFCKTIREQSDVPIIIISAKDEEIDKILGLELGGDDYLTKPFSPRELVARIKRLFRRTLQSGPDNRSLVYFQQVKIDKESRRTFVSDEEVDLTTKEFDLLTLLAEHPNRAFSREELLVRIWGDDYFGSDRAVDDLIKRIRKKVTDLPIETVWGFGYRLRSQGADV